MASVDRRVVKTKRNIDNAFWALMQEKDFKEITIRDVEDRAEINRVTFYRYYPDKYAWMEKKIQERMLEIYNIGISIFSAKNAEEMITAIEASIQHFDTHFSTYSILLNNKGTYLFKEEFEKLLLDVKYKMHGKTASHTPYTDFRFHFGVASFASVIVWWIKNDRPLSVKQLAQEIYTIHSKLEWFEKE